MPDSYQTPEYRSRLKLNLKVKRPLTSSLCRGLATDFTDAARNLWSDMCTIQLGGEEEWNLPYISPCIKEPEDLGKLTGMHGSAVINDIEYKFAIKDFNINTENYGGCPNREITLTGIL